MINSGYQHTAIGKNETILDPTLGQTTMTNDIVMHIDGDSVRDIKPSPTLRKETDQPQK
jgi:hypothetical protein